MVPFRSPLPTALISSALLLTCASLATARQDGAPPEAGTHTIEAIQVELLDGGQLEVERGVLYAPIVRADPESSRIEIEFHRFHAAPDQPQRPPIFLLNGGPGFTGLGSRLARKGFYEGWIQRFAALADVVVVGQRGIGSSKPDTVCQGRDRLPLNVSISEEQEAAVIAEACRRCKEHWEGQGLELSGLNVIEAAADVVEVAGALGYPKITIMGGSFGSHWGMAIMRFHPDRVARALLNGLEGPDHTYDMPSFVLNSLKRIAEAAEAAPELADHIPEGGLIAALEEVITMVEEEPVVAEVGRSEILFDARRVRKLALGYSGSTSSRRGARTWPADIIRLHRGDFGVAAFAAIRNQMNPGLPTASFFMLDCGSGISAERLAILLADPAAAIVGPLGSFYQASCPVWGSDLGEDFRRNFETDIPTVLVHGTWDTSTPFDNALELAPFFKQSKLVVVEGGSHGALREAMEASQDFQDALLEFLATGDMQQVPELVELPPLDWVVPRE